MARLFGPLLAIGILLLDQITKYLVTEILFRSALNVGATESFVGWILNPPERLGPVTLVLSPFLNLTMVWNSGISFGALGGGMLGDYSNLILIVGTLVIAAGFALWMMRSIRVVEIIALAMIVGGALGNLTDRVRFGAVIDFLDFYWENAHFPAFNVADASISIGVALLLIHGLFFAKDTG
ncbi:MAG: signal peptidase II [Rhodospirillales bacterium]|nr:signal peptidase II [Alphaproteobacteria bacterium]MCB9986351.1 signal peptidase II [Rhodospirillales bacterium]USO07100.1 MAG: signal peptidase II [Rhodospirillales bacterium]